MLHETKTTVVSVITNRVEFLIFSEHLELLERGELKSLYDTEEGADEDEEDVDTNEDDTEGEEPEANDEIADDRLSECEEQNEKAQAMNISQSQELQEFKIEVSVSFQNWECYEINITHVGAISWYK